MSKKCGTAHHIATALSNASGLMGGLALIFSVATVAQDVNEVMNMAKAKQACNGDSACQVQVIQNQQPLFFSKALK